MNHTDPVNIIEYENLKKSNLEFESHFKTKLTLFLDKGRYILGNEVSQFEQSFASYCGAKFCVGVANGLDALELGIKTFDFPKNSEIIVPSNTYIATILAIVNAGHIPILVEPDIRTYNINPSLIEENINSKTRAIVVVHLYGQPAQMDEICRIAKINNLEIIEDCAQAHGATFNGKIVGTFGNIGAYSFYPTKNLGALGDAGAVITSDEKIYEKLMALRNYGSEKKYFNKYVGKNSRLDELQAMFLNVKLPFLNKINQHKRDLAEIYSKHLSNFIIKPFEIQGAYHVYHIYNIRIKNRDELKSYLHKEGIQTEIHYPISPNKQEGYKKFFDNISFPISEEIHSTTLSLPLSYGTSINDVMFVINRINSFYN